MIRTETVIKIFIEVDEGCISCPFAGGEPGYKCAVASPELQQTNNYTYPAGCPLLTKDIIEVKRRV